MQVSPGNIYQLELDLHNTRTSLASTWLIGAFVLTYPSSEILNISHYGPTAAVVEARWRRAVEVKKGASISGSIEGVSLPGESASATVRSISLVQPFGKTERTVGENLAISAVFLTLTAALIWKRSSK